jgi:UDP-N-acetylglucosamine 2-epimerase (non-hydrolysing)
VTAKKEHIKVCHIEAGLRSGDMSMPEEINRLVTDSISDLLLTPDLLSSKNLENEGKSEEKVIFVGNIMIDTLEANRDKASKLNVKQIIIDNRIDGAQVIPENIGKFSVITIHRPSNVDKKDLLQPIVKFLIDHICGNELLLWSVHPRTKKQLQKFGLWNELIKNNNAILLNPLNYHDMLKLNMEANTILTDSGGLQEECCVLGTTCITLRQNTERPVTLREYGGVSVLVGNDTSLMRKEYNNASKSTCKPKRPELWDGHTAKRVLNAILTYKL